MIEIFLKLVELEALGYSVHAPRFGAWLEGAEHQLARVFLVVSAFVGDAQNGQLCEASDGLGNDIEVLASVKGDIDACHAPDIVAPHACAVDDHIGLYFACCSVFALPVDGCHAAAIFGNISDFDALLNGCAALACAFGEGEGDVGWVSLTI